jgi:1,4-alpha-glucan branching enzyme
MNTPIFRSDLWLKPYSFKILKRSLRAERLEAALTAETGSLKGFAAGHEYYGLHRDSEGWIFRERAPHAQRIVLVGEFSDWKELKSFEAAKISHESFELRLPSEAIRHGQLYKMKVYWDGGEGERIPSFVRRVIQDPETKIFSAQVWEPQPYNWKNPNFKCSSEAPLIYEAHVGMSCERQGVGSYSEFREQILPRIKDAGYNTIQLMAIQEHPYYGSFGYQVSSFFAPSSRFGTPEEFKALVDAAHGMGIAVIIDLVHSHAVKNEVEGISRIDGSYSLYFHEGSKGEHPAWNTRCFDYGKHETLHFLLSNFRYWIENFQLDGFRFDGITSMLYWDHGLGKAFSSYDMYFDGNVDLDALAYLTLANKLIHELKPSAITVAEDMSGMPGLAAPRENGGIGFDFRLAMGIPDYWIKIIKEQPDESWNVSQMFYELQNRRADERTISYSESHDQALVGDKTIIFRLADKEMYWSMAKGAKNLSVDRAIALHKMIRMVTLATAGHGYLNFMGNEFGHPEWIDFPREGNGWSFQYARRQWSLRDNTELRYGELADFDQALLRLVTARQLLKDPWAQLVYEHVSDQILAFSRGGVLFVFNFSPNNSFVDRRIEWGTAESRVLLSTDEESFGGFGRVIEGTNVSAGDTGVSLYLPARTGLVVG